MNLFKLWELSAQEHANLLQRTRVDASELLDVVRPIIDDVRQHGDAAVIKYTKQFDGAEIPPDGLKVEADAFQGASHQIDPNLKAAIETSYRNILAFHQLQKPEEFWIQETAPGVFAGEQTTPIDAVALYVPRGKGSFPSVMVMLGVPAVVAGVPDIHVFTPPLADGAIDPATLFAADLCGIRNVYKAGGVQAMAALAYGTETIPKVLKVVGPGSGYVTAAKRVLQGVIDSGLPAGPSEALVLADETAEPLLAALDLLNEAEHGPDSSAYLVTDSLPLAQQVLELAPGLIEKLPQWRREFCETVLSGFGGIVVTRTLDEAVQFVNDYAPEHLVIQTANLFDVAKQIRNAGEIALGNYTTISICNYALGPNAILPTTGFAKTYSAVSVRDFMKTSSVSYLTKAAYHELRDHVITFAEYEGFPAHALALQERQFQSAPEDDRPSPLPPLARGLGYHTLRADAQGVRCQRITKEAVVSVAINTGSREGDLNTGLNTTLHFLNHMLEHIAWRACLNISVDMSVTHYPFGHVICEDVGMTLGYAFAELWRQRLAAGLNGAGDATGIIDEAQARAGISFEDRAQLCFSSAVTLSERVEDMLAADLPNFFEGFAQGAKCTIHLDILKGTDPHHIWESAFRAFGTCLRRAFEPNPWRKGTTPGVKGI